MDAVDAASTDADYDDDVAACRCVVANQRFAFESLHCGNWMESAFTVIKRTKGSVANRRCVPNQ